MTPAQPQTHQQSPVQVPLLRRFTWAQWGVLCVWAALVLGFLPRLAGVGWFWSVVLLAGGWVVWRRETGFAFVQTTFLASPWFVPIFAGVVAAQAWQMLGWGLVSALWTVGAGLLVWGSIGQNEHWAAHFDGRELRRGYNQYVVLGVALCFVSLLIKWGQTAGLSSPGWSGGMHMVSDYNYYTNTVGMHMEYAPMINTNFYYYPGFALSGRSRPFALFAEFALLALLAWAAYRKSANAPLTSRTKQMGWGLLGFLVLWWINASRGLYEVAPAGPLLFLLGMMCVGTGLFFLSRGETEGRWDLAHLLVAWKQHRQGKHVVCLYVLCFSRQKGRSKNHPPQSLWFHAH